MGRKWYGDNSVGGLGRNPQRESEVSLTNGKENPDSMQSSYHSHTVEKVPESVVSNIQKLSVAVSTISGRANSGSFVNDLHHNIEELQELPRHLAQTTFVAQTTLFEDPLLSILIITIIAYGSLSCLGKRSAGRSTSTTNKQKSTNSIEHSTPAIPLDSA